MWDWDYPPSCSSSGCILYLCDVSLVSVHQLKSCTEVIDGQTDLLIPIYPLTLCFQGLLRFVEHLLTVLLTILSLSMAVTNGFLTNNIVYNSNGSFIKSNKTKFNDKSTHFILVSLNTDNLSDILIYK